MKRESVETFAHGNSSKYRKEEDSTGIVRRADAKLS